MIRIIAVGNLKESYLIEAYNEYIKRIKKYSKIELIELKESTNQVITKALDEEAKDIIKNIKGYSIKLAIKGNMLASEQLAQKIQSSIISHTDVTFIIGSSNGISPLVNCDYDLSVSLLTFPHQLMRVMLVEQIYRSFSILNNGKYHK